MRERLLAAVIGSSGTALGVLLIEVIPELNKQHLGWRFPAAWMFLSMLLVTGGIGGSVGHWAFLNVARGDLYRRAVMVGAPVGLLIGSSAWLFTYVFFDQLFPFHPVIGARRALIERSLPDALVAGALGGMLVALLIARRLKRRGDLTGGS